MLLDRFVIMRPDHRRGLRGGTIMRTSWKKRLLVFAMLAAMLAACLFRCLKWAKHAVRICYASSKNFQVLFSSGNSYRWFFLQPFKMLRAIFATASEMRGKSPAFGDKFFLFPVCALTFVYAAMLAVNSFIWKSSQMDLSTAKLSYCYLAYT